jgi:23S rRNA pseudouridine1911/1915/1917 synthase
VADLQGERLDKFLALKQEDLSRAHISGLVARGLVTVNGAIAKASYRLKGGELVEIEVAPPPPTTLLPQDIPITVAYEDEDLLVVDKPAGMVVHPAPGHPMGTLVNALLARLPDLRGVGEGLRPGIVHRLDKDTSGLMVVAKNRQAHEYVSRQIKERAIRKVYIALAMGALEPAEGMIRARIGRDPRNRKRMAVVEWGREAETSYRVTERLLGFTLLEAFPKTGRTHQIRVHLSSLGHPLAGDSLYGGKHPRLDRQFLHAHILGFRLPTTEEYMEFTSPLPVELDAFLVQLRGDGVVVLPGRASKQLAGRL